MRCCLGLLLIATFECCVLSSAGQGALLKDGPADTSHELIDVVVEGLEDEEPLDFAKADAKLRELWQSLNGTNYQDFLSYLKNQAPLEHDPSESYGRKVVRFKEGRGSKFAILITSWRSLRNTTQGATDWWHANQGVDIASLREVYRDESAIHDHGPDLAGAGTLILVAGPQKLDPSLVGDRRQQIGNQAEMSLRRLKNGPLVMTTKQRAPLYQGDIMQIKNETVHQMGNEEDFSFFGVHLYSFRKSSGDGCYHRDIHERHTQSAGLETMNVFPGERAFDLDSGQVLRTEGGMYFGYQPTLRDSTDEGQGFWKDDRDPAVIADFATWLRHQVELLRRLFFAGAMHNRVGDLDFGGAPSFEDPDKRGLRLRQLLCDGNKNAIQAAWKEHSLQVAPSISEAVLLTFQSEPGVLEQELAELEYLQQSAICLEE